MIVVPLDLQHLFKGGQVIGGVRDFFNRVLIPQEFKHIGLVKLAVFIQAVIAQVGFVDLFHLSIQAVVLKRRFGISLLSDP